MHAISPVLAASVDFSNPMIWAILIGWILSVVLHEFAHGLVAYWGGDYTIRERGGLTLNPLQYVDPVMSIILPAVFLLMGGVPLPGGVTYVRRDLIRNRFWQVATSAAGPAMNFLLFLLLVIPLHPRIGWVDLTAPNSALNNLQIFCGAMAVLQLFAVLLNLVPVPPLDGFQIIAPFLPDDLRTRLMAPPTSTIIFVVLFLFLINSSVPWRALRTVLLHIMNVLGLGFDGYRFTINAFITALFGG